MKVAYVTDLEGQWQKLQDFARDNPCVALREDAIVLQDDAVFVFGGDIIDRGPDARRLMRAFIAAKQRYGERMIMLAGNRDINKLRLWRELRGLLSFPVPQEVLDLPKPEFLRWLFRFTMNTPRGLEFRMQEVQGTPADAVESFLTDVQPGGLHVNYLLHCQLAFRHGRTLFVHGSVTEENIHFVPERPRAEDVDAWIASLNSWYREKIDAYVTHAGRQPTHPAWNALIAYQAPIFPTRVNQASVVYSRHADREGNPTLPRLALQTELLRQGITRVVVGHSPIGDIPAVLHRDGFQWVLADNSYSPLEYGAQVIIDEQVHICGRAQLPQEEVTVRFTAEPPIGLRVPDTRYLVKAPLADGWLLGRLLPGYKVDQVKATSLPSLELALPMQ